MRDAAARLLEEAERVGIEPTALDTVVVTPTCGLGLRTRETALTVQRAAVDLAGELNAVIGGASGGPG